MSEFFASTILPFIFGSLGGSLVSFFLSKISFEFQTKFSRVYETRARVIQDLYKLFSKMELTTYRASKETGIWNNKTFISEYEPMNIAIDDFAHFYYENRIFLTPQLTDLIKQSVLDKFDQIRYQKGLLSLDSTADDQRKITSIQESLESFRINEVTQIREKLEQEFRKLIGVS
jgi:hypothetical protein